MSEASDDAQLAAKDGAASPSGAEAPPDTDDVEVLAHPPEPEPTPRHDSVNPTSRKLAPPPKPKRDSQNPSVPPPEGGVSVGSMRAPGAPSISYHDLGVGSRDSAATALASSESLRTIGEALAKDAGAFSTSETPTGQRPAVPRPRSQPSINLGGDAPLAGAPETRESGSASEAPREPAPSRPDAAAGGQSASPPKTGSIFAQRIISVGTPAERSPAPPAVTPSPQPPVDLARTLEVAPQPPPVEQMIPPPAGAAATAPVMPPPAPVALEAPTAVEAPPVAVAPAVAAPAVAVAPAVAAPAVAVAPAVAAPAVAAPPAAFPPAAFPPPVITLEQARVAPAAPLPSGTPFPHAAATEGLDAAALPITVDIPIDMGAPDDASVDDAPPDIPITTDEEEGTPSPRAASPSPLETAPPGFAPPPPLAAPQIPDEPTPAPPAFAAAEVRAELPPAEDAPPDSLDRIQVEELSREDSPSVPPDEPAAAPSPTASSAAASVPAVSVPPPSPPAAPPPVPARTEVKPPPPPKRAPVASAADAAAETEKKKSKQKRPWWEELFSEDFVRANWKVSDDQIKREVTFVEESLGVAPGGVVLDLGCGSGQHAVELASRGYGVVGYDLSLYQLALAADNAQERSQKINFLQGDMREMAFEEMFDGIFCWNTSFGYFEEDKNFSVAERAFRALRPGGMFLVDVINRDFVAAHTPSSVWFEGDACVCMDDAVIDYFTSRLRVKRSVILDDGRTRECTYSVRLYSFHELGKLLHEVGFRVTEVSGHPATPGVFLGQASPRILMLAQRP